MPLCLCCIVLCRYNSFAQPYPYLMPLCLCCVVLCRYNSFAQP
jgi:hypothetical protein